MEPGFVLVQDNIGRIQDALALETELIKCYVSEGVDLLNVAGTSTFAEITGMSNKDPEKRARASQFMTELFTDPVFKAKHSEATREAMARPEVKKKQVEGLKRAYANDPTYAKRVSEKLRKRCTDPEVRQENSKRMKALFADPIMGERMRAGHRTPEAREKKRQASLTRWAKPGARERMSAKMKAHMSRPEIKAKYSRPGASNPNSKLTNAQAAEIRLRLQQGETQKVLAEEFGISQSSVSNIKHRVTYSE
jgi:chemotaxis protein histidine kinase CheA